MPACRLANPGRVPSARDSETRAACARQRDSSLVSPPAGCLRDWAPAISGQLDPIPLQRAPAPCSDISSAAPSCRACRRSCAPVRLRTEPTPAARSASDSDQDLYEQSINGTVVTNAISTRPSPAPSIGPSSPLSVPPARFPKIFDHLISSRSPALYEGR